MRREITQGLNLTESEAVAKIGGLGFHTIVAEVPATENDFHWHDFDSATYVLEGSLDVTDHDTGEVITLKAGDLSFASRGFVHREKHNGFKAVFGLSVDPATLTFPIELPLPAPA